MKAKDIIIDLIRLIIVMIILTFGMIVFSNQLEAQTKEYQLMDKGTWIGTMTIKKHSNSSPLFALSIKNRTDKYIVLNVTFYDGKRIVLRDLIRVGKDYYLHKAFTCIDNLTMDIRQRTNVRKEKQLEVL